MNIQRLELTRVRAFDKATFDFTPGANLLVGLNGVGKTTVLDVLRACLSKVLPAITASRSRPLPFDAEDIRGNSPAMTIRLVVELAGGDFEFLVHKQRERSVPYKAGEVRQQTLSTPDKETCIPELSGLAERAKNADRHPLAVFFSTRRSLVSDTTPSSGRAAGGEAAAYADALGSRELRLADVAYWMQAQQLLAGEHPQAKKHLAALRRAAREFLPECRNLRAETSPKARLLVDKEGLLLDVRQLSDGERSLLALVLDLARRLSQANPGLAEPTKRGEAVVLIDELDLHLHPKWQRTIVERLTKTFPRCQFIATTHSPQIVAAVEPERVLLLTGTDVVRPDRTLGMDSNWVLLRDIEGLIKKGAFTSARAAIASEKKQGFDLPEWSVLEARMARLERLR
jgi:hypothetical protein